MMETVSNEGNAICIDLLMEMPSGCIMAIGRYAVLLDMLNKVM